MKKWVAILCMVMIAVFSMADTAIAGTDVTDATTGNKQNFWSENDMSVEIYDPRVYDDGVYHVEYHNSEAELVPEDDLIRLIMINGGFVPCPDIKVTNNRTLVPLRLVSELLGANVDWDEKRKTITVTEEETKISLTINSREANINGQTKMLDVPPSMLEGKTYVPVRFIAEALSADVGYVASIGGGSLQRIENGERKAESAVSVVTIEKPDKSAKAYSIDEGLVRVKEASAEEYKNLLDFLKKSNRTFESGAEDYDSQDIVYTNEICGRYYVYRLAAFSQKNIFFNKYTGEIYSECDALPFLCINKGFINIGWTYQ
jgi:hypothetical protein